MDKKELLEVIQMYRHAKTQFVNYYQVVTKLRDSVKTGKFTLEELVDRIFVLRETSKYLEDIRKEIDGVKHIMEQVCCAQYTVKYSDDPGKSEPIRATLATGTPKLSMRAKLPKLRSEPERYHKLLKYFGIPDKLINSDTFRPHWPSMCEHLRVLAEEGKPLPDGINPDETYPVYSVTVLSRKDLEEILDILDETDNDIEKALNGEGSDVF